VPRPDQRGGQLAVIPGTVPAPTRWPHGCRFRARCPYAWDLCQEQPGLMEVGPQQRARCWLVEHPERRAEVERHGGGFTGRVAGRGGRP
jgi:ABC-type dipeptide/oligopeptide/nickel transport system ATPase component